MLAPNDLERIDQLLNELEGLAHSDMSPVQLFGLLCERLRFLTSSLNVVMLLPTDSSLQGMLILAGAGQVTESTIDSVLKRLRQAPAGRHANGQSEQGYWFCVALRADRWTKGLVVLTLSSAPAEESKHSLIELMAAFAEIASVKQLNEVERFLDNRWHSFERTIAQVAKGRHLSESSMALVNHLLPALGAVRICLVERNLFSGMRVSAISGVSHLDRSQEVINSFNLLAGKVVRSGQPTVRHSALTSSTNSAEDNKSNGQAESTTDDSGLFPNIIALPLLSPDKRPNRDVILIVEWSTYASMVLAMPVLSHVLPLVGETWKLQRRWLRLPAVIRRLFAWELRLPSLSYRLAGWALLVGAAFLAYRVLEVEYPLTIEAPATLEPKIKRSVFATADGYIDSLLVEDGQTVTTGQAVAKLRSPTLDLQIEELNGQQRSLAEKRSGLKVAINQIDPSSKDALLQQSRLSAEVAQTETQETNLQKQLKLLSVEREKLSLISPISGVVVARDLKQQLMARPVRRGDALFTVVDLQGPWQLRIEVADRDTGYLRDNIKPQRSSPASAAGASVGNSIEFVLDSLPEKRFEAEVQWVSDTVQNHAGQGCYLEIRAAVDRNVVEQSHMGAGALVFFQCSQQPLWFVWCRPLVEASQRKFWFWSEGTNNDLSQH